MSAGGSPDFDFGRTHRNVPTPLPTPADALIWHVSASGQTVGPGTVHQIRRLAASGVIPYIRLGLEGRDDRLGGAISQAPEFANNTLRPSPAPVDSATTDTRKTQSLDAARTMQQAPTENMADSLDYGSTMPFGWPVTQPSSKPPPTDPSPSVNFPVGHILDDRLVITRKLGKGGMGAVYRVTDRETDVDYAIKVLIPELVGSPAALADLRKEVARAQPLTHQNLLNIKYLADSGPVKYVVMEHVDGEDLESYRLRKGGKIPPADFAAIAPQILAGLEFLHERGVVHLDIKPQNIMVSKSGDVKITDYGISRTISEQLDRQDETDMPIGTLCFMPPEQFRLGTVCDRRADIYALGMTFHLLLTGRFPFPLDDRQRIVQWHIDEQHAIANLGHSTLNRAIGKALASRAESRYGSCKGLLTDLSNRGSGQDLGDAILSRLAEYTRIHRESEQVDRQITTIWATQEEAVKVILEKCKIDSSASPTLPLFALNTHENPGRREALSYCLYAWAISFIDIKVMESCVTRFLDEFDMPVDALETKRGQIEIHTQGNNYGEGANDSIKVYKVQWVLLLTTR